MTNFESALTDGGCPGRNPSSTSSTPPTATTASETAPFTGPDLGMLPHPAPGVAGDHVEGGPDHRRQLKVTAPASGPIRVGANQRRGQSSSGPVSVLATEARDELTELAGSQALEAVDGLHGDHR